MKLDLTPKLLTKHKLTLPQLFLLLSIREEKLSATLDELLQRQAIVKEKDGYFITQHFNDIVDELMSDATGLIDDEEWLESLAKDFAKTFPQGKMPGTPYYYRCNTHELVLKFKKFFISHPEYKPSEQMKRRIIEASKRYNLEMDNTNPRYRTLSKYFISKLKPVTDEEGVTHNEEVSQLASYLENEGQEDVTSSDGWPVSSRN